jgi:outer membrane receptor protein involved in Fe transport
VYGAELGFRAYPVEGLDVYANYTLMDVVNDTTGCNAASSRYVPDQRTSAHKINAGVQIRTKIGIDALDRLQLRLAADWALEVTNVQAQRTQYESFHLDPYEILNARIGYRFFKNAADLGLVVNNVLDNQHREYPLSQPVGRRIMGTLSYRF